MKKKVLYAAAGFAVVITVGIIYAWTLADLRNDFVKENINNVQNREKAKELLLKLQNTLGGKKFATHETYEVIVSDHWQGMTGKMANAWPVNNTKLKLQYETGTFNSRFLILEGDKEGVSYGLQNWKYYKVKKDGQADFTVSEDPKIRFILPAYQWFFEFTNRVLGAPEKHYAGEEDYMGQAYDKVFVTWSPVEPVDEHDQYMLYINKETGLLDFISYTVREQYLPGPKIMYATIRLRDYRDIDSVKIPFLQTVYMNRPKEGDSYIHQAAVESFTFDSFSAEVLKPDDGLSENRGGKN